MIREPIQLPLSLVHRPQYGREDFITGRSNEEAVRMIDRWPDWPSPVVVLDGAAGAGKTHLANIWADRAGAQIVASAVLGDEGLPGIVRGGPVVVEDFVCSMRTEPELFHLINTISEHRAHLLITAAKPVGEWPLQLPDLRSRLRLATPVGLGFPDDDLLRKVLVKLFADRQLIVDKPLVDYLLLRMERSLSAAVALVEALDRVALAEGRRITRSMAARVLPSDLA